MMNGAVHLQDQPSEPPKLGEVSQGTLLLCSVVIRQRQSVKILFKEQTPPQDPIAFRCQEVRKQKMSLPLLRSRLSLDGRQNGPINCPTRRSPLSRIICDHHIRFRLEMTRMRSTRFGIREECSL